MWGILLVLVVGVLTFRFRPESPWVEILATLFGIGAALALDQFALWPASFWARRFYGEKKMARTTRRNAKHEGGRPALREHLYGG